MNLSVRLCHYHVFRVMINNERVVIQCVLLQQKFMICIICFDSTSFMNLFLRLCHYHVFRDMMNSESQYVTLLSRSKFKTHIVCFDSSIDFTYLFICLCYHRASSMDKSHVWPTELLKHSNTYYGYMCYVIVTIHARDIICQFQPNKSHKFVH